jgi:2-polyprenyl-3-methyl-5-hydroxy-6-metoxy-1,4-benzoquinol methylase
MIVRLLRDGRETSEIVSDWSLEFRSSFPTLVVTMVSERGSEQPREVDSLLAEQAGYYRAIAGEYEDYAIPGVWGNELPAAIDAFAPTGRVLELACGPGVWTRQLLEHAVSVTAVEASAEMIAIASERVRDERVRFINANIFDWTPDGRYDVVFFGFWLSHVPLERFESFWALVRDCLAPDGRVFFVDDAHRTPDELVYGESSPIVRRRLNSGAAFRVVKVPHKPHELEQRLKDLGWRVTVTPASGRFFWGTGRPA